MKLNVADLKKMIKECVVELKEQFQHDASKSIAGNKAATPDGPDSGDKKMGPTQGNPPQSVKNTVEKVKEQKGAMKQNTAVGSGYSKVRKATTLSPTKNTVNNVGQESGATRNERKEKQDESKKLDQTKKKEDQAKQMDQAKKKDPKKQEMDESKKKEDEKKQMDETKKVDEKKKLDQVKKKKVEQKKKLDEDATISVPVEGDRSGAEVTAEVVPGAEQGQPTQVELVIIDDDINPENINQDEIEIEIPDGDGEEVEIGEPEGEAGEQAGEGAPMGGPVGGQEVPQLGGQPGGEQVPQFDRFEDLAGLKKEDQSYSM